MADPPFVATREPSAADDAVRAQLQLALGAHYVLGREVGGGGMARVYVARDESLGRDVAVKVFRPELAAALSVERFAREIRVAAALQEPHIVPVLAAGATPGAPPAGGLPYYTMPFVRGESLRARLDRGGALPPAEAVAVLGDVLRALAHAHAHGVVHRDIKPENILLVAGGAGAAAVVTDFGIAKALRASSPTGADPERADRFGTEITGTGVALGTPAYMAPEQAAADPGVDERADLYAWGLVAYETLAGRHPFAAHTGAHAMLLAQLTAQPATLGALLPELPASVADVVMRCLEKEPAARPPRAADALAALDLPRGWRAAQARRPVTAHAFRLSDAVLRRLDRATLDPRLLGGAMQYLENDAPSDVLLFCVHGLGHEGAEFAELLATVPHRAVAPTLFGFEPDVGGPGGGPDGGPGPVHPRVPLAVEAHLGLLRALLDACVARLAPARVVLVGFSSGADLVLRLLAEAAAADVSRVDGCLALGPNLSLATCFASRVFARLPDRSGAPPGIQPQDASAPGVLADLRRLGDDARDLDEWLNVMTYQLHSLRKFRDDVAPLRRLAADVVRPFERPFESAAASVAAAPSLAAAPFPRWFRAAAARGVALRCVFERSAVYTALVQALRLENLDGGLLGPHYREDALVVEDTADHFALLDPARIARHLDALLAAVG